MHEGCPKGDGQWTFKPKAQGKSEREIWEHGPVVEVTREREVGQGEHSLENRTVSSV